MTRRLERQREAVRLQIAEHYARKGVAALAAATPVDSGLTANQWHYEIVRTRDSVTIQFHNTNVQNGVLIALILQLGHGTRNGGWVEGRDYINPALQPVFDEFANAAWKEVTNV